MELFQLFDQTLARFGIRNKDLSDASGRGSGYISEIRRGVCGIPLQQFGELLEVSEKLAPGFKKEFASRVANSGINSVKHSLSEIASQIDSGHLTDEDVAQISNELANVISAISRRLVKTSEGVKKEPVSIR
jgi:hypothetical protein